MITFSIPALTMENEFHDLVFVGRYVDDLVERTKDLDYAIVYEWDDDGPGDWPPVAVLARLNGKWWRRPVLVSGKRGQPRRKFGLDLGPEERVNDH
jgi:hypothetical protein